MAERKTTEERLALIREKQLENKKRFEEDQKKLKAEERKLAAKANAEERKKRNHRLIEVGGAVESICRIPIEKADIINLISFLKHQEKSGFFFSRAMGYGRSMDSDGCTVYSKSEGDHNEG